jgi:F-box protein 18 (helicase)
MNVTLFEEMVKTVRSGRPLKLGFAGGIQKYEFDMYLDIHRLRHGRRNEISHKFVKKWKDFNALAAFAERTDDVSLLNKIKICEKYAADLPKIIEKIKSMHSRDISRADIVFSTAHKSKGLEFDTVKLTDDYSVFDRDDRSVFDCDDSDDDDDEAVLPIDRNTSNTAEIEERNLLYVAVTRAKKSVILTPTLARVLKAAKEYFVYPTVENSELREGVCSVCRAISRYPALRLQSVSLSDGPSSSQHPSHSSPFPPGMVCTHCAAIRLPFLLQPPK